MLTYADVWLLEQALASQAELARVRQELRTLLRQVLALLALLVQQYKY
jgi:hypothetical protein